MSLKLSSTRKIHLSIACLLIVIFTSMAWGIFRFETRSEEHQARKYTLPVAIDHLQLYLKAQRPDFLTSTLLSERASLRILLEHLEYQFDCSLYIADKKGNRLFTGSDTFNSDNSAITHLLEDRFEEREIVFGSADTWAGWHNIKVQRIDNQPFYIVAEVLSPILSEHTRTLLYLVLIGMGAAIVLVWAVIRAHLRRLQISLVTKSLTDPATSALNLKGFTLAAEKCVKDAHNQGQELSALMVSLQSFPRLNNEYTLPATDELLKQLVVELRRQIGSTDVVGRSNNCEFIILLKNTYRESAQSIAEKLREVVSVAGIRTSGGQAMIDINVGLSTLRNQENLQSFISRLRSSVDSKYSPARPGALIL